MRSKKTVVIAELYRRHKLGEFPDGIVLSEDVTAAMDAVKSTLSRANPANFLKDVLRSPDAKSVWPAEALRDHVAARQRYGERRVMQFVPFAQGTDPFANDLRPKADTPVHVVQSASIPHLARALGRMEETWLTQIAVQLRLVETHLSIFSPAERADAIKDVLHLQTGIKTQPEIDAAWIATYGPANGAGQGANVLVICEVKQRRQPILENQIREQVAKAFDITKRIEDPRIDAVKPIALTAVRHDRDGTEEPMLFLIEFAEFERSEIEALDLSKSREALFELPLTQVSSALYRLRPPIPALGRTG